jgi:hypothetical protein
VDAPEEVVRQLQRRRRLERRHLAALRVAPAEHELDRPVLAPGVHRLEHHQQRVLRLGVQQFLQLRQPLQVLLRRRGRVFLALELARLVGGLIIQLELRPRLNQVR